jgi:hypothetical protein
MDRPKIKYEVQTPVSGAKCRRRYLKKIPRAAQIVMKNESVAVLSGAHDRRAYIHINLSRGLIEKTVVIN